MKMPRSALEAGNKTPKRVGVGMHSIPCLVDGAMEPLHLWPEAFEVEPPGSGRTRDAVDYQGVVIGSSRGEAVKETIGVLDFPSRCTEYMIVAH